MYRYKDIVKLLITFTGILLVALSSLWWAGEARKDNTRDKIIDCQSQIKVRVKSHEERIHAVEKWLESNTDLPETMAKIEANTSFMSQRMNEIYQEIKTLRKYK